MDRMGLRVIIPVAVALAAVVALIVIVVVKSPGAQSQSAEPRVLHVETFEEVSSATADDWAMYAEFVVTATAVNESFDYPSGSSETMTLADELVGRRVEFTVDQVLWTSPNAVNTAPEAVELTAMGYDPSAGTNIDVTLPRTSRLEVGHTYVLALEWWRGGCFNGANEPGTWTLIGLDGVIPYDEVLGAGEFEGEVRTLAEAEAYEAEFPDDSLRKDLLGDESADVQARLDSSSPAEYAPKDSVNDSRPYCS